MNSTIRKPKPGDFGRIITMHGEIYFREFGFNSDFEINIASKLIRFYENADSFDSLWINETDGECAGSIAVSKKSVRTAFINFLLVSDKFRRLGIAQNLLNTAIHHTIKHRFAMLRLETYSCLRNARKLYRKAGFKMAESVKNVEKFGKRFDQEFWELKL